MIPTDLENPPNYALAHIFFDNNTLHRLIDIAIAQTSIIYIKKKKIHNKMIDIINSQRRKQMKSH